MKVLILGAGGMLGNAMFSVLSESSGLDVWGGLRSPAKQSSFSSQALSKLLIGPDAENCASLKKWICSINPDVVINCVGVIKQLSESKNALKSITINALLPHQLFEICAETGARLIHFSTDCVFSGSKGLYAENDFPDANDLYGRTKYLGEVAYPNAITIRTSIIGHEIGSRHSLVNWFLSQTGHCQGFTHAFFSGLTTMELAMVVREVILPDSNLYGVYHVAGKRISKYDLLTLIAKEYGVPTKIVQNDELKIDRSLDASRFNRITGYTPPVWPDLVRDMHTHFLSGEARNV